MYVCTREEVIIADQFERVVCMRYDVASYAINHENVFLHIGEFTEDAQENVHCYHRGLMTKF